MTLAVLFTLKLYLSTVSPLARTLALVSEERFAHIALANVMNILPTETGLWIESVRCHVSFEAA